MSRIKKSISIDSRPLSYFYLTESYLHYLFVALKWPHLVKGCPTFGHNRVCVVRWSDSEVNNNASIGPLKYVATTNVLSSSSNSWSPSQNLVVSTRSESPLPQEGNDSSRILATNTCYRKTYNLRKRSSKTAAEWLHFEELWFFISFDNVDASSAFFFYQSLFVLSFILIDFLFLFFNMTL